MMNEVISTQTFIYFFQGLIFYFFFYKKFQVATKYGSDAEITAMLDYADWLITPVSNPDGYEYTWTTVYAIFFHSFACF